MDRFIVAEVSKNWVRDKAVVDTPLLSQQFEGVVNRNHKRGYRLHSFSLHRLANGIDELNETIIAVFEKQDVIEQGDGYPDRKTQRRERRAEV